MDPLLVAFLGYVLGTIGLTVYNYMWKKLQEPEIVFDSKYAATMLISIILSVLLSMATFTTIQFPVDGTFYVFIQAFTIGFSLNVVVNKPISYLSKKVSK